MDNIAFTYKDKDIEITASKEALDNFDINVEGNSCRVQPKIEGKKMSNICMDEVKHLFW